MKKNIDFTLFFYFSKRDLYKDPSFPSRLTRLFLIQLTWKVLTLSRNFGLHPTPGVVYNREPPVLPYTLVSCMDPGRRVDVFR